MVSSCAFHLVADAEVLLLFWLLLSQIEEVAALMKTAGVEPNETTKKILQ